MLDQRLIDRLHVNNYKTNGITNLIIKTFLSLFISLITRMRYKRDIKMGRLYTPGGAVIGIVGGGVTFRFF